MIPTLSPCKFREGAKGCIWRGDTVERPCLHPKVNKEQINPTNCVSKEGMSSSKP